MIARKPLPATHLENVLELSIHRVALFLGQFEPGREQFVWLAVRDGREIQSAE